MIRGEPILRLESVAKTYADGTRALKGVSFQAEEGEFIAILGKSGSGKSTLLRCINRLVEPTAGRIFLGAEEITGAGGTRLRALRRKIGMIFQDYNLVRRASVLTNVLCGRLGYIHPVASLANWFPLEDVVAARAHLEQLGIAGKETQRAGALSGGQQQRVGIARALMQKPRVILADEPVSSLDPATSRSILQILRQINRHEGVTILCNLHLPELAREFAGRILSLKEGSLVYDGPVHGLSESLVRELYELPPDA